MKPFGGRPFMQTAGGRAFPLLNPSPEDVNWEDVAHTLAYCNRFAGSVGSYSVAQHSIIVTDALPIELRPYGLLHDGEEFATGDMTTPVKQALMAFGVSEEALRGFKLGIRRALHIRAGLTWPVPHNIEATVKAADIAAVITERRDLLVPIHDVSDEDWLHGYPNVAPLPTTIRAWTPRRAFNAFLAELNRYNLN